MNYSLPDCKAIVESCITDKGVVKKIDLIKALRKAHSEGERYALEEKDDRYRRLKRDHDILQERFNELRMCFNKVCKRINRDSQ